MDEHLMAARYQGRTGERLARVLSELGYGSSVREGGIRAEVVCDVVNREMGPGRRLTPNMLRGYLYQGKTLSLDLAATMARILNFDLKEIAYDSCVMTNPRKRKARGFLDQIDPLP